MNASTADQIIGDAQIAQYNDKGYLVIDAIYSPAEVAEMRHAPERDGGKGPRPH